MDYNDVIAQILLGDVTADINLLAVYAGWHHTVKARIFKNGVLYSDIEMWGDSHEAVGQAYGVNFPSIFGISAEEMAQPTLISEGFEAGEVRPLVDSRADINGDLRVDEYDLSILMHSWGLP